MTYTADELDIVDLMSPLQVVMIRKKGRPCSGCVVPAAAATSRHPEAKWPPAHFAATKPSGVGSIYPGTFGYPRKESNQVLYPSLRGLLDNFQAI
ncbi:hypothetical protein MAR_019510 [Mya arenaria]|uniref:Uncharacterized protein n=1 Tax=Mya arenaria TaxID=6604 RepID=A0ABY7E6F6_MYAAR|nr:hypothetical protein MAR_019510 [Mya arenaria]